MFLSIHFIAWTVILWLVEAGFFACVQETVLQGLSKN